jgi:MoaA/NifB/PqqE/SkfB family radical SAM enzyme
MYAKPTLWAEVDDDGRLSLPAELADRYGIKPGTRLRIDPDGNCLRFHRPVSHLAKIYIEATNKCNLNCKTCIRNGWDVELGQMSSETYQRILEGVKVLKPAPTLVFVGMGEPLAHPATTSMVAQVKMLGARVELVTNATLLSEDHARELIEADLDMLWVSLDGAKPDSYADIRLGASLPEVLENIMRFRNLRPASHRPKPEIGIVFVAMKRNINDLPAVLALGRRLRVSRFLVSNVLPYTQEMCSDTLYERTLRDVTYSPSQWLRHLSLPKMDIDENTGQVLLQALRSNYNVSFAGNNLGGTNDVCTYIESGSLAVGWNGNVSPCPPLLYRHTEYLHSKPRSSYQHIVGNVAEHSLLDIWNEPEYKAYRDRVQRFAFAPCTFCGGCDLSEANQTDCFLNPAPACGGCLWAQGVIQCP